MTGRIRAAWLDWPQTKQLAQAFAAYRDSLRFVGGAVRDTLLQREVHDVDAATILLPEKVMALLQQAGIHAVPTGIAHGTVTAVIDGKHFEITTLRKDTACDGRHAQVEFTDDWRADAMRRDFTMNAMYLSPEGTLFDYSGGEPDAIAGRVKFIGDPRQRIAEDYLRVLRFFRFYAHYGKGAPDAEALAACRAAALHLQALSGERVQHELLRLLAAPSSQSVLELMLERQLLVHALAVEIEDVHVLAALEKQSPAAPVLVKLAALLMGADDAVDASDTVAARLKLSNANANYVRHLLSEQRAMDKNTTLAAQKKLLRRAGKAIFSGAVMLAAARDASPTMLAMVALAHSWQVPPFPVRGEDLLALGMKPGKAMGEALHTLETQWEESDYALSKEALLGKVK